MFKGALQSLIDDEALAIIFAREADHFTFALKQLTAQQAR